MLDLDAGWATDVEVHRRSGATVEDRGDHLIVRTPANPTYHWGNCVLVMDPRAVQDAGRWNDVFREAFPDAAWMAVGLPRMPDDPRSWNALGLELELLEVLTTESLPRQRSPAGAYTVRELAGDDWEQTLKLVADENGETGAWEPTEHEPFARRRMETNRSLCEDGGASFFGAYAGDELVAQLGIVVCDATARYQHVVTAAPHRRRGLASHLVGVAGRWASDRGCRRWVIVAEADDPAELVYRGAGFALESTNVQVYRPR